MMIIRHRLSAAHAIILVLLVLAVGTWACGGSSATTTGGGITTTSGPTTTSGQAGAEVIMKGLAFDPASITIKVGDSVTWTNQDSVTHTVVGDNGEFTSSDLAKGQSFTFAFPTAGTFAYHCSIHPSMKGTVVVQ